MVRKMRGTQFAELTAFVAVAERGSFTKAANHLGIAQATLSQTIRALEDRLGVRLLNRTTRSVAPTEVGARLLQRLRPLLDDLDAAVEAVNAFRDKPAGPLRLTVPPTAASIVIAPLLSQFLAEYPDLELEVSVDAALIDIVRGRFDAGIRYGERVERDMVALRISDGIRQRVVASPGYLARHPRPIRPNDLHQHNCIRFRFPSGAIFPWLFEIDGKSVEVAVSGSLVVNDVELALRSVLDGIGLLYGPDGHVAHLIAQGRLVPVLESWTADSDCFYLYYPSRRQMPAALRVLIDFLKRNFKTDNSPAAQISPAAR